MYIVYSLNLLQTSVCSLSAHTLLSITMCSLFSLLPCVQSSLYYHVFPLLSITMCSLFSLFLISHLFISLQSSYSLYSSSFHFFVVYYILWSPSSLAMISIVNSAFVLKQYMVATDHRLPTANTMVTAIAAYRRSNAILCSTQYYMSGDNAWSVYNGPCLGVFLQKCDTI